MIRLPLDATDEDLLAFADRWAERMAAEDYAGAFVLTGHDPAFDHSPEWLAASIRGYHEARPRQHVTMDGSGDPNREVYRRPVNADGDAGDIWYDLYIDNELSQMTATFWLRVESGGLDIWLSDIHVM